MKLADAASYFDRLPCADAYDASATFYGQMEPFDDSKRDGATVIRRVLSVASGVEMPARGVITIAGEQWIIGQHEDDFWRGALIRRKYVIQRADGAASIRSPGEAIAQAGGTATYAGKLWIKDSKEIEVSSKLSSNFNLYLHESETASPGKIVVLGGELHIARGAYKSAAGFLTVEVEVLPSDALAAGTYSQLAYSPATDTYAATDINANFLKIRYQDDYEYLNESSPKYVAGDCNAFVAKSVVATAKAKDKVSFGGEAWNALSVADADDCWSLHLRRTQA